MPTPPASESTEKLSLPEEEEGASDKWKLVSWLAGARTHRAIAGAILRAAREGGLGDSSEDALRFIRGLQNRGELAKLIRAEATLEALIDLTWAEVTTLQDAGAATSSEVQSKFAGSVELSYGGLDSFFGGLEGVIGPPNPKLLEAMAADHKAGPGTESTDMFLTGNCEASVIQTTPPPVDPVSHPSSSYRWRPNQLGDRVGLRRRRRSDARDVQYGEVARRVGRQAA